MSNTQETSEKTPITKEVQMDLLSFDKYLKSKKEVVPDPCHPFHTSKEEAVKSFRKRDFKRALLYSNLAHSSYSEDEEVNKMRSAIMKAYIIKLCLILCPLWLLIYIGMEMGGMDKWITDLCSETIYSNIFSIGMKMGWGMDKWIIAWFSGIVCSSIFSWRLNKKMKVMASVSDLMALNETNIPESVK